MVGVEYVAAQWRDYFVMVGGAAAALTGLVFVALSLNARTIAQDATHRYRAVGTLSGLVAAFSVCALALAGSGDRVWVGSVWLVVAAVAMWVYASGYRGAVRGGGGTDVLSVRRTVTGTMCNAVEMVGAALLIANRCVGIYIAAVALVLYFSLMVSGAWLLVVGVRGAPPADTGA